MSDFDRFWALYPRRVGKGAARKEWAKAILLATPEEIIAGLERQIGHINMQYRGPSEDFRPHARTWLHQERWDDEVEAPMTVENAVDAALEEKWEREERASIEEANKRIGDSPATPSLPTKVVKIR